MELTDFLEHHGVKGQKWGVRNERVNAGLSRKQKKKDLKWQKNIYTISGAIDVHNNVANKMNNGGIDRLNARHPNAHLDRDTPATRAYIKDYENLTAQFTESAVKEVHGSSPSGRYQATLDTSDPEQYKIVVTPKLARHAADSSPTLTMELEAENGKIVLVKSVKEQLAQATPMLDFFEHHGVKGMHWGIRKKRSRVTSAHPQSSDSKKVTALKERKPHQLTNKQLKTVNERLNLEKNFGNLNPGRVQKGHSFAKEILAITGTAGSIYALSKTSGGQKLVAIGKKYIQKGIAQGKLLDAAHLAKMAAIRGTKTSSQLALF